MEKCPLKAVFYYEYKNTQFFPRHPDADIGNIIHNFYENRYKWKITNKKNFSIKWNELTLKLNDEYKKSDLQSRYFPVQWYSNFYAIKKQLLVKNLLRPVKRKNTYLSIKNEQWIEDEDNIIAGKVDLLIYNDKGIITEISDFKTGKIFEKVKNKLKIKEAFKTQLALYAKIIIDKQQYKPETTLIDISGKKHPVKITSYEIDKTFNEAKELKHSINIALQKNKINELANPYNENCFMCNYRPVCRAYKQKFMNFPINNNIDICGKVIMSNSDIIKIENEAGIFR
ncbi:MAG: PD-(D/E)XK nuclease family protein [Saprospiraceae bacterium]